MGTITITGNISSSNIPDLISVFSEILAISKVNILISKLLHLHFHSFNRKLLIMASVQLKNQFPEPQKY